MANLLVALLVVVASADNDFYECLPGITPYIGVSTPKGDTHVERGEDPFYLYCHLNPDFDDFKQGDVDSSMLSFQMSAAGEGGRIILNTTEIQSEVVNRTTIRHLFNPDTYGTYNVDCRREKKLEASSSHSGVEVVERDGQLYAKLGFCPQRIFVGYPPRDVENFACVSENWENLNCTWDEPWNPIPTTYRLKFKAGASRFLPPRSCPEKSDVETHLMVELPKELHMCYLDLATHPSYRQVAETIKFFINATNRLHASGSEQTFSIAHYGVVRPGPAEKLHVEAREGNTLQLSFSIPRTLVHFPAGLVYAIRHKSNWTEEWKEWETGEIKDKDSISLSLDGLDYAWTDYEIQVKLLSGMANASDSRYWSDVARIEQRTLPVVPPTPPTTHPGSFEIIGGINDRTVVVFWKKLDEKLHNGDDFRYTVTNTWVGSHPIPLEPHVTTSTYMEFRKVSLEQFRVSITSENTVGQAPASSTIVVPPARDLRRIQPKSFTRTLYPDNVYEVAWLPPKDKDMVVSYTVFWCKYKKERPHYCEGLLSWRDMAAPDSSIDVITHNISLPDSSNYQMAVTANTKDYSSGLVWATCTIIKDRVVGKLKDVSVDGVGETTALVRWRLDCQDRIGIVTGYEVVYCPINDESDVDKSCPSGNYTRKVELPDAEKTNLTDMVPWTPYKIMVRVITRGGEGELSDPIVKRTNPSAPGSLPNTLTATTMSNSAQASWLPPSIPNGAIDLYKVIVEEHLRGKWREIGRDQSTNAFWKRRDLKAYTSYRISVIACNKLNVDDNGKGIEHMACTARGAVIQFRTKVGRPGRPNEPVATFKNSSIVELNWDEDFQLGAERAERWEVRVSRAGPQWDTDQRSITREVDGSASRLTIDLRRVQEDEDWSPDCDNVTTSQNSNKYNFTIRAVVKNSKGEVFKGDWSRNMTQPNFCEAPFDMGKVAGIVAGVAVPLIISAILCFKFYGSIKKHMKLWGAIGRELDDKMVVPLTSYPQKDGRNNDYDSVGAPAREGGGGHRRDNSKDSLKLEGQGLLKERSEQGRGSDTTSGCESAHSSELGDREGGVREEEMEEEVGPLLSEYVAPPGPGPWLGPGEVGYTRCVPPPTLQEPASLPTSYTRVANLPTPAYVNQAPSPLSLPSPYVSPPPLPPSSTPAATNQGYVTFNSVKSAVVESSPGYITIAQLSPGKEVEGKEAGSPDSPVSPTTGYSRVALTSSTPGYVPWTAPEPKSPLAAFEARPTEEEVDSSLVISPRALARESTNQGISSMV